MSEEIVISYNTETLKKESMSERERAIYDAGYEQGYANAPRLPKWVGVAVVVILLFMMFNPFSHY